MPPPRNRTRLDLLLQAKPRRYRQLDGHDREQSGRGMLSACRRQTKRPPTDTFENLQSEPDRDLVLPPPWYRALLGCYYQQTQSKNQGTSASASARGPDVPGVLGVTTCTSSVSSAHGACAEEIITTHAGRDSHRCDYRPRPRTYTRTRWGVARLPSIYFEHCAAHRIVERRPPVARSIVNLPTGMNVY
jgi:hypothetical protein